MKAETVYQKMVEKVNKNFTNSNMSLDRARAVYLFNEAQNIFVESCIERKNTYKVEDIQRLLDEKKLKRNISQEDFVAFLLPENLFNFVNVKVKASNSNCGMASMLPFYVKPENIQEVLHDENNKPSFKYREVPYTIEDNTIRIYKDNFDIDSVYLKYYRYPVQFNLEGYIDIDNTNSYNVDPEFNDKIVDRIISISASLYDINSENLNRVQFDSKREELNK